MAAAVATLAGRRVPRRRRWGIHVGGGAIRGGSFRSSGAVIHSSGFRSAHVFRGSGVRHSGFAFRHHRFHRHFFYGASYYPYYDDYPYYYSLPPLPDRLDLLRTAAHLSLSPLAPPPLASPPPPASSLPRLLEHDPEKWEPVFPRDKREAFARRSCSNKKLDHDPIEFNRIMIEAPSDVYCSVNESCYPRSQFLNFQDLSFHGVSVSSRHCTQRSGGQ